MDVAPSRFQIPSCRPSAFQRFSAADEVASLVHLRSSGARIFPHVPKRDEEREIPSRSGHQIHGETSGQTRVEEKVDSGFRDGMQKNHRLQRLRQELQFPESQISYGEDQPDRSGRRRD